MLNLEKSIFKSKGQTKGKRLNLNNKPQVGKTSHYNNSKLIKLNKNAPLWIQIVLSKTRLMSRMMRPRNSLNKILKIQKVRPSLGEVKHFLKKKKIKRKRHYWMIIQIVKREIKTNFRLIKSIKQSQIGKAAGNLLKRRLRMKLKFLIRYLQVVHS